MREGMQARGEFIYNNLRRIILTILIVIFSIGIIIKFSRFLKFLKFIKTNPTFYLKEKNALVKDTIPAKDIKTATYSKEFTLSAWININQYSYKRTKSKMIFCMVEPWSKNKMKELVLDYKDDNGDGGEEILKLYQYPGVWFEPLINNIKISMVTKNGKNKQVENCYIPDVPINEWFYLTITLSSRGLDTYINGKLVRTIVLQGDPVIKQGNLLVNYFGGYSGSIQKLQYSTRSFLPKEVQKMYDCGRMTSFIFDWFIFDRCRGKTTDPTAPSEKCSAINNFNAGMNRKMWYLPDNICDNLSETIDWNNAENTYNNSGSNGPEIGKDISCLEIEEKYRKNEIIPLYNKINKSKYFATEIDTSINNLNKRSGLNYKARHMDYN